MAFVIYVFDTCLHIKTSEARVISRIICIAYCYNVSKMLLSPKIAHCNLISFSFVDLKALVRDDRPYVKICRNLFHLPMIMNQSLNCSVYMNYKTMRILI